MAAGHAPSIRASTTMSGHPRVLLRLTSEFQLLVGSEELSVPRGVQRLLAFLAIAGSPVARSRVAGQLWLDVPEWRALGNLRSALWRLRRVQRPIVRSLDDRIALDGGVVVDLEELTRLTGNLSAHPDSDALSRVSQLVAARDLLPGWEDEWIIIERERFRELRIHALERASRSLLERGYHAAAMDAALAAVEAEPFRDSAQRLVVQAYLSEGNAASALRAYLAFRDLMEVELGIEPSDAMQQLVADLHPAEARLTHR